MCTRFDGLRQTRLVGDRAPCRDRGRVHRRAVSWESLPGVHGRPGAEKTRPPYQRRQTDAQESRRVYQYGRGRVEKCRWVYTARSQHAENSRRVYLPGASYADKNDRVYQRWTARNNPAPRLTTHLGTGSSFSRHENENRVQRAGFLGRNLSAAVQRAGFLGRRPGATVQRAAILGRLPGATVQRPGFRSPAPTLNAPSQA